MRKLIVILACLMVLSACNSNNNIATNINSQDVNSSNKLLTENHILNKLFAKEQIQGCLVIIDPNKNFYIHNVDRANIRYSPASTFKVYNSLIALDNNIIDSVDEVFYFYNGDKAYLKSWEQDASLRTGIKVSNVLAFKKLANLIGYDTMQEGLLRLNYGNKNITTLNSFWLDNSLKISALEQAILIDKLAHKELNFKQKAMQDVIDIILLETHDSFSLYGKTGFSDIDEPAIGLFIGFIHTNKGIYSFALNIDDNETKFLDKRINLVKEAFVQLKFI